MNVAVCFNLVPSLLTRGEAVDRIAEEGAELEAHAVAAALVKLGHTAPLVPLGEDLFDFAGQLRRLAPDLVFNLCEGFWGNSRREMHVAALFELLGLTFTGAPPLSLGLTQDKVRTKDLLVSHKLPTPRYQVVRPGEQWPHTCDLVYPLIVKPQFEDASHGISDASIVEKERELRKQIKYVHTTYKQGALVEEFIDGREINAALIGKSPWEVLPLSEIRFHPDLARPIVSYEGKWLEKSLGYKSTKPICPTKLSKHDEIMIQGVAVRACKILDCRDYARVDIRLRDGIPYILEINANPDISPDAGLARSAKVAGMNYPQLIGRILDLARKRKESV